MRTWMSEGLVSLIAFTSLCGSACNRTARDDSQVSASKQAEQAQNESKDAYDRAKKAQDKAIEEQREASRAEDKVAEKRNELAEAEAKAEREAQESQNAQAQAQREGVAAQQQAEDAQQRAAAWQAQQVRQSQERSAAQARTGDTHQMQTRSAQSHEGVGDYSWVKPGTWNSAPTNANTTTTTTTTTTDQPSTEQQVTQTVQTTAAATFVDNALLTPLTNSEITVTNSDDKSLHVLHAKVDANTKIKKDGKDASFNDIVDGDHAKVSYHMDHNQPIAESIEITSAGR